MSATMLEKLTRAQELLQQLARDVVAVLEDNKRLRDELTAVTLERDELKRLSGGAPALLALLKELIDIEGPQPGNIEWARKVHTAIAKAEGRS